MKPYTYALLAVAAACGVASAQTSATTTPVGYETLSVATGFNYLGLRLHQATVAAGTFETVGATSLVDDQATFALTAGKVYIVEINNGSGFFTTVTGASAVGTTITTTDNLQAVGVANGASYSIREAATLSSVFGATNSAGLTTGFGGIAGSDVVFVANATGGFDQYYFDELETSWCNVSGVPVAGDSVPLIYTDGVIISSSKANSLVVVGEVKKTATMSAVASGFNYLSTVYPAGATLASTFGGAVGNLDKGFGGIAGADVFFVSDGSGGFNQYYFDELENSWCDVNGSPVDGNTISLASGLVFSNEGAAFNLKLQAPASYSNL